MSVEPERYLELLSHARHDLRGGLRRGARGRRRRNGALGSRSQQRSGTGRTRSDGSSVSGARQRRRRGELLMSRSPLSFRALVACLALAASSVGCQVIFGDYKIDDNAFRGGGGSSNTGGSGNNGGSNSGTGRRPDGTGGPVYLL